jgi:hypothetical protein
MQQAGSCRTQSRAEADLRQTPCGVTSADHRSRSHAIPMSEQCNASAWTCSDEAMRYNRCTSPATFSMVSCNNSCIADQHQEFIMSIPECERYRNSTMFVGSPPFGYEGTDDRTSNNDSTWHPPRTPPHSMVYREHICPHPGPCQDTFIRGRSPAKLSSTEADVPDLKLVDVVPALYSSPELNPHSSEQSRRFPDVSRLSISSPKLKSHITEDTGYFPDISRLSIHDNEQSRRPDNDMLSTLDGEQRQQKSCINCDR